MRYGVMHVKQVEIVQFRNLGHARSQRQIVWREVEQGITRDINLVVMNIWMRTVQANGLSVGDEVDLVSTLGEFHAEFGSDHATAAVSWITSDTNLHPERLTLLRSAAAAQRLQTTHR